MQNNKMLASALLFLVGFASMSQNVGEGVPQPPAPPPPPGLPIDSGIVLLIVVALTYGAYKTYQLSKKTA
ncbi:hypothetical protein DFQ11_101784 [Winogradskyella epiphytica]|uniref:Signal peptidase n=1 Tax=Winogradskyella epiphytica TaxID=262005 RepID=A0A2V4XJ50_9FLAO|nr:hypothetical protein DFQ11_101784 [Winogradskyella epiphytica]GGW57557.1 hypothetical protein GCM10008085_06440 [Winogradskyella epiphytica]